MKVFKIILAAMVIFAAGVVTGGMVSKKQKPLLQADARPASPQTPSNVGWSKERKAEYIQRLDRALALTAEQKNQIEAILDDSNEKMREHWTAIEPRIKEEYRAARKQVSEVLTPEQRKKQEEWRAQRNKQKSQGQAPEQKNRTDTNAPQKLEPEAK
ncbi:MAG: hypothetical protein ACO1QB_09000 [Verrucomicrobiales bacterium]